MVLQPQSSNGSSVVSRHPLPGVWWNLSPSVDRWRCSPCVWGWNVVQAVASYYTCPLSRCFLNSSRQRSSLLGKGRAGSWRKPPNGSFSETHWGHHSLLLYQSFLPSSGTHASPQNTHRNEDITSVLKERTVCWRRRLAWRQTQVTRAFLKIWGKNKKLVQSLMTHPPQYVTLVSHF